MRIKTLSLGAGIALGLCITACATTPEAMTAAEATADPVSVNSVPQSASLCRAVETALFQCQAGERTIALCGGGSGADRYVQYRYGMPGAAELTYPARGLAGLTRANIAFSGGGETQVNFTNRGASYTVYSRTVRTGFDAGGNNPEFSAGVTVRQGRSSVEIGCTNPADATFDAAIYDWLPEGEPVQGD